MDFKIDFGPWREVYSGKFSNYEIEVVTNPAHVFLVFVYEKVGEKRVGALVEGYKAFIGKGNLANFAETSPKPGLSITKKFNNQVQKMFFLSMKPIYLDLLEEDFLRKLDKNIEELEKESETIIELAKISSIDLQEIDEHSPKEYSMILDDPFTIELLALSTRKSGLNIIQEKTEEKPTAKDNFREKIPLGIDKNRKIIEESPEEFIRTIIIGNESEDIRRVMYVIAENLMLHNHNVLIFDNTNFFDGLKVPSENEQQLKEEQYFLNPMGFNEKMIPAKNFKPSLADADFFALVKILGIGDNDFEQNLATITTQMNPKSYAEMIQKINLIEGASDFEKLKIERIYAIMQKEFEDIFGEEPINLEEITKNFAGRIGKAIVLNTKGLNLRDKTIYIQTMLIKLLKESENQESKVYVLISEAEDLFGLSEERITQTILTLEEKGIGVILGSRTKNIPQKLLKNLTAKIEIVNGRDCAFALKNQNNFRINIRPSLSGKFS